MLWLRREPWIEGVGYRQQFVRMSLLPVREGVCVCVCVEGGGGGGDGENSPKLLEKCKVLLKQWTNLWKEASESENERGRESERDGEGERERERDE